MCLYGDTSLFYFWISKLWFSSMGFCKGLMVAVLVLTWSIKVQVEPIHDLVIQSSSWTYFWIGFEFDVSDLINKKTGFKFSLQL